MHNDQAVLSNLYQAIWDRGDPQGRGWTIIISDAYLYPSKKSS